MDAARSASCTDLKFHRIIAALVFDVIRVNVCAVDMPACGRIKAFESGIWTYILLDAGSLRNASKLEEVYALSAFVAKR